jgi:hypothetical protein
VQRQFLAALAECELFKCENVDSLAEGSIAKQEIFFLKY